MNESKAFDWNRIWMGNDLPLSFLGEIAIRSFLMYLIILISLRVMGKRGIKQLSLFEFSIILALGSSAGDPMFYEDVPLLHGIVVFVVILLLYVFFNFLTEQSSRVERWFEGEAVCILQDGKLNLPAFKSQKLTYMEFFGEMRQYHIEHLGQVRKVYLEATGEISIFFFDPAETQPGLPIWPERLKEAERVIAKPGQYACKNCGQVQLLEAGVISECPTCQKDEWLFASQKKRLS